MKLINKIIIGASLLLSVTSCDYLDIVPDNIATMDNAFADRYQAEKFLATCYWGLPDPGDMSANPGLLGSLELVLNTEKDKRVGMQYGLGYASAVSPQINYWSGGRSLYPGIRDCNTFLDNIEAVEDLQRREKDKMIAEVKVLKAYQHFYLIMYYGPICPLRVSPPVNESTIGTRVVREKVDDCFAYVVELLDEVIESGHLPLVVDDESTELGRFTAAYAYALKAKVLTYWASPLFNGNTDYNSFVNADGEPFFNQEYDATRWTAAAEACKAALDKCAEAGIDLYQTSDYSSSTQISDETRLIQTLRSSYTERWNPELIWGNTTSLVSGSTWNVGDFIQAEAITWFENPSSMEWGSSLSVPLSTVEKFYSKNGVPINEDKSYDYANRFTTRVSDAASKYYIAEGETTAAINFDREPRFYAYVGFDRGIWYGNTYKQNSAGELGVYVKARFGEYSATGNPGQYNQTGYWPKKLVSVKSSYSDDARVTWEVYPYPEMRYTDLLLMYAEALNESKDAPDAEVYDAIDRVRSRAGLDGVEYSWTNYSNNPNKYTSKAGMREIIQQERNIELAFEGAYFWDSRRWKTAIAEQNRSIQGWSVTSKVADEYYIPTTYYTQRFTFKDYFAPIPEDELIKNLNLVQNPGW